MMGAQEIAPSEVGPIQVASIVAILLILAVIYSEIRLDRREYLWSIPLILWMVHGLAFYTVLAVDRCTQLDTGINFTIWSSMLRLHGYLTILGVEVARLYIKWYKKCHSNGGCDD